MQRIGIAASKMSQGNLCRYNLCVVVIACLFSIFTFLICGFVILFFVFLAAIASHVLKPAEYHPHWLQMAKICLIVLGLVVGILNIAAILKNIQWTKNKI